MRTGKALGPLFVAVVAAIVLAAVAGWAIGRMTAPQPAIPGESSAEAGFARDMQTHHLQAVDMSMIIRDRTDAPEIRQLAYDIARTQQQQAGQMYGWLSAWGLSQATSQPVMAWMGETAAGSHSGMAMEGDGEAEAETAMPGMATAEEIARLKKAEGTEAERLYLELMIDHHAAGVTMAQAILDRTENPAVTSLARSIVKSQQSEIDYMKQLLAQR